MRFLNDLRLYRNAIRDVDVDAFLGLGPRLRTLYLGSNRISRIEDNTFLNLTR